MKKRKKKRPTFSPQSRAVCFEDGFGDYPNLLRTGVPWSAVSNRPSARRHIGAPRNPGWIENALHKPERPSRRRNGNCAWREAAQMF